MSFYNLTTYDNITTIAGVMSSTNEVTGSWFSYIIMIIYYYIMFLMFKSYDSKMVFFTSSISLSVLCTLFFLGGFVSVEVVGVSLALVAASTIYFKWRSD